MFSLEGYHALRQGAGLVARDDRGMLAVTGQDRLTWLQGLLTQDVSGLVTGQVRDAAYLTPQGRMVTDLRVIEAPDRTLLDVPASLSAPLRNRLDGLLFSEDAQIEDASSVLALLDIHGPEAPAVAAALKRDLERAGAVLVLDAAYGVPGVTLVVPRAEAAVVAALIVERGAVETTLETLDVVRVEAGRPRFLVDMDDHTIPLEAGIEDRAVSFTKGCYVGQEVIVRVMHRGQGRVAKKLVGLMLGEGATARPSDSIVAGDRDVGRLTSVVSSPTLARTIALGYVHRDFLEPGTQLTVRTVGGDAAAVVAGLPFVLSGAHA